MTTVFLYPQTEAKRPAKKRERLKPIEREVKSPPTSPWERERLSSIKGRMGEKIVRVEKFRYQRHQKMKRGRILIPVIYCPFRWDRSPDIRNSSSNFRRQGSARARGKGGSLTSRLGPPQRDCA